MTSSRLTNIPVRIACSLVAAFVAAGLSAQGIPSRPQLVVGIMVDGLNADYLRLLKGYFSDDGFKRLLDNGVVFTDIDYGDNIDATAATAIAMTGAAPSVNGIPSRYVYDQESRRTHNIFGSAAKPNSDSFTPASLLVSTIGDEIRIDAAGTGYVYSIAPDAERAILMAGHAGNSAVWINELTEKWASSPYYKEMPQTTVVRNINRPLSMELDTISWTPLIDPGEYPDIPAHKKLYPFRHVFQRADKNRTNAFIASPMANRSVTDLATEYISTLNLGKRGVTDMLGLGYTVVPYPYTRDADNRVETLDSYLRLDRDLARLFRAIDNGPGRENTLVFVAGTPAPATSRRDDEKWGIPYGEFSAKRAISLLNMYLIALHGNGEWVSGYHDRQFYLNHAQIKSANLPLRQIREESAEFLARMSGVSEVHTIDEIAGGTAGDNAASLKRNTSLKHAGDLMVSINPGWESVDDDFQTDSRVARSAYTPAPLIILAPGLEPKTTTTRTDARTIAPTVSRLIRIRAPNGAALSPAL
ncbi:MAG: alkaline phosphatase family protein [Clostridium sp.]|nr:alkaline phosphatase family protein [Clostridium sp.]